MNDFVEFGRIYQVKLGAQAGARAHIDDVMKLSVRNRDGSMVPFSSFTQVEETMGLNLVSRYNMYLIKDPFAHFPFMVLETFWHRKQSNLPNYFILRP